MNRCSIESVGLGFLEDVNLTSTIQNARVMPPKVTRLPNTERTSLLDVYQRQSLRGLEPRLGNLLRTLRQTKPAQVL